MKPGRGGRRRAGETQEGGHGRAGEIQEGGTGKQVKPGKGAQEGR